MSMPVDELEEEALQLPKQERAKLAQHLIESLDSDVEPDVEQAWLEEVERRYQEYKSGKTTPIPVAEVFEDAFSKYK